ncbi:MAG: hypothetical protein SNJ57_09235 [Cyanobacteriota bacterium]
MKKRNSYTRCIQYLADQLFQPIVFADAAVFFEPDGFAPTFAKTACWNAQTLHFCVESLDDFRPDEKAWGARTESASLAEFQAISSAIQRFPGCQILSDSRIAIMIARRLFPEEKIDWIPRDVNAIADYLTKRECGTGYIAFNAPLPVRGWIDLVYE